MLLGLIVDETLYVGVRPELSGANLQLTVHPRSTVTPKCETAKCQGTSMRGSGVARCMGLHHLFTVIYILCAAASALLHQLLIFDELCQPVRKRPWRHCASERHKQHGRNQAESHTQARSRGTLTAK